MIHAPAPDGAFAPSETFSPKPRVIPISDAIKFWDGANAPSRPVPLQ
jgi:hypothetical protein